MSKEQQAYYMYYTTTKIEATRQGYVILPGLSTQAITLCILSHIQGSVLRSIRDLYNGGYIVTVIEKTANILKNREIILRGE